MTDLLLNPTPAAQWQALVCEAKVAADHELDETLESYLVFLLMRFTTKPELANRVLALEYLESFTKSGVRKQDGLRDVGDQCLLFSGLFPQRAQRRRVKVSYFVDLGRSAYHELSENLSRDTAKLFDNLARDFIALMEILQSMRQLSSEQPLLGPIDAFELWADTGSKNALRVLGEHTKGDHASPFVMPAGDPARKN